MWKHSVLPVLLAAVTAVTAVRGEILHLDDEAYGKLPKLFAMDHYQDCLTQSDGAFCLATFSLSSPKPSPLFDLLTKISSYEKLNYNHTKLHRGVCVTKSCRKFLNSSSIDTEALVSATEACVNQSMFDNYGLDARIEQVTYCKRSGEKVPIDFYDRLFVVVVVLLILFNLIATFYDVFIRNPNDSGIPWLMAFSVPVSWNQLTVIRSDDDGDVRLNNLRPIQGIRVLTMFLVVMSHVVLLNMFKFPPDNPRFIEVLPYNVLITIMYNGHFIMQTFMLMASFLLSYNFLIFRESIKKFSWKHLSDAIVQRFLRLTPSYMLVVSFAATWASRITSGPLCFHMEDERYTCRKKWWLHLFYIHNVVKAKELCMPQTWYLGADMQLFLLGITLMVVTWRYPHLTRKLMGGLLVAATGFQFVLMYFFKLKPPLLMQSPERVRNLFKDESSFWNVHTTFQGNMQGYLVGLIIGMSYYKWEKEGYRLQDKTWFRVLHYLSFPMGLAWIIGGYPFILGDDEENRLYIALYSMVDRLLFAIIIGVLMLGCFYKIDTIYLRIMQWRGWQAMGRLSFNVMLIHTITYFNMSCAMNFPRQLGFYNTTNDWFGNLVITYLLAIPITIFVEFPTQRLTKVLLSGGGRKKNKDSITNGSQVTNSKKIK